MFRCILLVALVFLPAGQNGMYLILDFVDRFICQHFVLQNGQQVFVRVIAGKQDAFANR